jgi:chromate reductase
MKILAISGSVRRDSHNRKVLLAAAELMPDNVEFELFDGLKAVPPYDEDDDGAPRSGTPPGHLLADEWC